MSETVGRPASLATVAMLVASSREPSSVDMKAPEPVLTSITKPPMPSESFLLRIDAVMSGMLSTVAVTSRSE